MAVKRKSIAERKKSIGDAIKDINKAAGETVIGTLNDEEIAEKLIIDYIATPSFKLNNAIGGGVPRSKFTLISGPEDVGKTMLALETIADNIKKDLDFVGAWCESENSLEESSIKMFGLTDKDLKERFIFMNVDDMPAEEVLRVAREQEITLVGLSALMTTTVKSMEKTIMLIRESGLNIKVMVGGAVLTEEYAKSIGADFYAKDAMESVKIAENHFLAK